MDMPALTPSAALEEARSRTVAVLSAHFVHDHLGMDELESRLGQAVRAADAAELDALTRDLPALPAPEAAALGVYRAQRLERVPDRRRVMTLFGDFERTGRWTVPRRLLVITGLGDVKLDFREACFGPDPVELVVHQGIGDLTILVPPGVRVQVETVSLLGDRNEAEDDPPARRPDEVLVRVSGTKLIGDVKVATRLPGEPEKPRRKGGWFRRTG